MVRLFEQMSVFSPPDLHHKRSIEKDALNTAHAVRKETSRIEAELLSRR